MQLIITLILILILLAIAWQDFKHMRIWILFLILALTAGFIRFLLLNDIKTVITYCLINLTGTILILLLSILYMFLRRKKVFNPINTLLGSGDLFFLPVLCFSFSPVNYIVFIIVSSFLITIGKLLFSRRHKFIPLAGSQAVMLVVCICISEFSTLNMYSDAAILNLLG